MAHYIRLLFVGLLIWAGAKQVLAQDAFSSKFEALAFYADAAMNSAQTSHRVRANDSVVVIFQHIISNEGSFSQSFDQIAWISTLYAPDSTFRIFTWQLNRDDSLFSYHGYIQFEDGRIIQLEDNAPQFDITYAQLPSTRWPGARYYEIIPFPYKNQEAWILLGFDAYSRWNRRKIAETLYFEDGEALFGIPVFGKEDIDFDRNGKCRLVLTYSLETKALLTFDTTLNMIVHDHFISFEGRFPGQGQTQVPDGSYEGYRLNEEGFWIYKEKLFDQVMDKPPVDSSKLSPSHQRDLFGNKRSKN